MKPIQAGLLGLGTVGGGVFDVLRRNQDEISSRAGRGIQITMVAARYVARAQSRVGPEVQVLGDASAIIANPDIAIVIELIGDCGNHKTLLLHTITALKQVITTHK